MKDNAGVYTMNVDVKVKENLVFQSSSISFGLSTDFNAGD